MSFECLSSLYVQFYHENMESQAKESRQITDDWIFWSFDIFWWTFTAKSPSDMFAIWHVCFPNDASKYYFYRKFPKYSDTQKICCNHSKIWTMWFYPRVMSPNDADGMANSVDPDQTAPLGAVWSGSALFAQAYLSENLGSLR